MNRVIFILLLLFNVFTFKISATENPDAVQKIKNKIHFYPLEVRKIDSICSIYNLHNGVGNYWLANRTSMFSRKNVKIRSVYFNLNPHTHNANKNWYYDVIHKKRGLSFDFAVFKNFDNSLSITNALELLKSENLKIVTYDDLYFIISSRFYYSFGRPFIIREDRQFNKVITFNFDTLLENKNYYFEAEPEKISIVHYCKKNDNNFKIVPHASPGIIIKIDSLVIN